MPIDQHGDTVLQGLSIRGLPKVSLHDHLDGGVRPQTIIELGEAIGLELPRSDGDALAEWFAEKSDSGSLVEYLKTFDLTTAVMQTKEGLTRVAREFVEDLAADGVIYGEVRWAPEQHLGGGLSLDEVVEAVQTGIDEGEESAEQSGRDIRVGQLITAMRHTDRSLEIAELAVAWRGRGAVGFDIAGPEDGFPPSQHRAAFDYLAAQFFPATVHAGEAAGTDSIVAALDGARAERLGHGVRIADEVADNGILGPVAQRVLDAQVPLEVAPSSNVQTGAYPSLAAHPVGRLHRLGFAVTVNTDNRLMSGVSVTSELTDVARTCGWGWDDVQTVTERALAAAFLPEEERARLLADVVRPGYAALRA
jgi:adenosine deaminase